MAGLAPFIAGFQSLTLATIDDKGFPFSSYAPFVAYNTRYYIFISDIARHARNLQARPRASLFFIEDEKRATNIFARKRAALRCESRKLAREEETFGEVMGHFKEKFDADLLEMLLSMKDFNLYELTPLDGEAVFGFGEAYDVGGKAMDQLIPRRGGGHAK